MQLETTLALDQELHGVPVMVNDHVLEPGAECGMIFRVRHDCCKHIKMHLKAGII